MNCCLTFLFYNSIAGIFIFIILGIFVLTDNQFLIIMNLKEIDGKKEFKEKDKRNAYIQYFVAAGFNIFFAFIIWYIPNIKTLLGKKNNVPFTIKNEMQKINETNNQSDKPTVNNNEINTNMIDDNDAINKTSTEKNIIGMTEKMDY